MRKMFYQVAIVAGIVLLSLTGTISGQKSKETKVATGPVTVWPRIIPARIGNSSNMDLFVMTLGEVTTPIADGTFDPVNDRITLSDGKVINHYYRDSLRLKYYSPVNKTIFPLPPSGMCTWYYYYQHVTDREVRLNTDWIAANLKDYGANYVQIDDGWQKETATLRKGSRDWTGTDRNFSGGMASLASYIKSKGLIPGIWIAPHGQSNPDVVKSLPGVFILKPDGTSASKSWEGDWLVDPSTPETQKYLSDLFKTMADWGYEYFKIDGQPTVVGEFRKAKEFMRKPGNIDSLYRSTLKTIKNTIGPQRYLLGCWGLPVEGAGIMDGSRTGGDVVLGWDGFESALRPTMRSYYQHNIMWYTDPDVMLLRQPLTVEQARVWATLQGLTGQALMSSDRLTDLSTDRVDMLKKVYPAVDIRPLDLFPSNGRKRLWDLKVNHLGRKYDVTGLFNFGADAAIQLPVKWSELGIETGVPVHIFDFWNSEYMGAWEKGIAIDIPPTSVRVLTLLPDNGQIQLISTSRHITQGWVDLQSISADVAGKSISGVSNVPDGENYKLHFVYPRGIYYRVKEVSVNSGKLKLTASITNHQGWAEVAVMIPVTGEISWKVAFESDYNYKYEVREPEGIRATPAGEGKVKIAWRSQYYLNVGYQVYLDGALLGYTPSSHYDLTGLDPKREYHVEVRTVWDDGAVPKRNTADTRVYGVKFIPSELPAELPANQGRR